MKSEFSSLKQTILLACPLLLLACGATDHSSAEASDTPTADTVTPVAVETTTLRSGEVVNKIRATGTVFPQHDALVAAQTSGTILAIQVSVGERVQAGTPLIQVDAELKQLAVDQAEAKLLEAKAAFEKANKDLERNKQLHSTRDISDYVYENARLQKESAEALYLAAQAQAKIAQRHLRDATIVSPLAGIVAQIPVDLGNSVAPGIPVARVVDISRVRVKFGVPEQDISSVSMGKPASISVEAFAGANFEGRITAVGPQADLASRTFPVEITADNPGHQLRGGMIARVEVLAETLPEVTLLPKNALLERGGKTYIYVIKDGIAIQRQPVLGVEQAGHVALLEGAISSEVVVVSGQENLLNGSPVVIKNVK